MHRQIFRSTRTKAGLRVMGQPTRCCSNPRGRAGPEARERSSGRSERLFKSGSESRLSAHHCSGPAGLSRRVAGGPRPGRARPGPAGCGADGIALNGEAAPNGLGAPAVRLVSCKCLHLSISVYLSNYHPPSPSPSSQRLGRTASARRRVGSCHASALPTRPCFLDSRPGLEGQGAVHKPQAFL